jgi:uncharacterized protein YcbX
VKVEALYRYPVKSMLGDEIDAAVVGEQGFLGDRAYALIDQETGKIVSAKNPRRWAVLFQCRATYLEEPRADSALPPVRVTLPDGSTVDSDDPEIDRVLSNAVERAVRLESIVPEGAVYESLSPVLEGIDDSQEESIHDSGVGIVAPGTFFDAAPLHVLTTASLARLADLAPESNFAVPRFRPNVVVDADGATGFVENEWVSHSISLGDVAASVFLAAPRCVMTTVAQPDLPRDLGVLQTIARHNRFDIPGLGPSSCVGVYALVTTGGVVRRGDRVEIT